MNVSERLPKESAREYAYRIIKDNIISLQLQPGSLVSENELAAILGLSRTPVREALIELSKLKIVEIFPQRGSYISLIDGELVEEARFLRLTLEMAMAQLACEVSGDEDIMALEENIKLQEFFTVNENKDKQLQLDNEFHELLFRINNKSFTYELFGGLMTHFDRVRTLSLTVIKDHNILSDHMSIVSAIKNRDKELVKNIVIKHLSRYKIDEQELRKEYPQYFK